MNECGTAARAPQTLSILRRPPRPLRERRAQLLEAHSLEQATIYAPAVTRVIDEWPHEPQKCIRRKQRVAGERRWHVAQRLFEQHFRGARRGKGRQERERP